MNKEKQLQENDLDVFYDKAEKKPTGEEQMRSDIKEFVANDKNQTSAVQFALQVRYVMGRAWFTPEELWKAIGEENQKRMRQEYPDVKGGKELMEIKLRVIALFGLIRGKKWKGRYKYRTHMTAIERAKKEGLKKQVKKVDTK